jgi:hypothetical protein
LWKRVLKGRSGGKLLCLELDKCGRSSSGKEGKDEVKKVMLKTGFGRKGFWE